MERDLIKTLFENFVVALEKNDTDSIKNLITVNITLDFSTIGKHIGKNNVLSALKWKGKNYDNYTIRITNFAVHEDKKEIYQSAYIQSCVSYEENNFMHAFLYGGHFVNSIIKENNQWKFNEMRFDLDYVDGNTSFVENWWDLIQYEFFKGQKLRTSVVAEFDSPWRKCKNKFLSDEDTIKDVFYHYAFALDTADFDDLINTYSDDVKANMPQGSFVGKRDFTSYFKYVRLKEPTFSHAGVFKKIEIVDDLAYAEIYRTEPHRRGTRFLHKGNKNCIFFTACYNNVFQKIEDQWYIKEVKYKTISETIFVPKSIHYLEDMEF